jgi:tetratricopeptide (TPR) repeat protein
MLGHYSEAEGHLKSALRVDPGNPVAHFNLAIAQKGLGKEYEAVASYQSALAGDPNNAACHNNLGNVLLDLQEADKAIESLCRAVCLDPSRSDYYYNLGRAYKARGLRREAVDAYTGALRLRPDFCLAVKDLGAVHLSLGNCTAAEDCYKRALELNPADFEAIAGLARVYTRERKYRQAEKLLEPCLREVPDNAAIGLAFAGIAGQVDRSGEAVSLLNRQISQNKNLAKDSRAQIHFKLGQLYDEMRDYRRAFANFQEGNRLRSSENNADAYKHNIDEIIASFSRDTLSRTPRSDTASELPVFIVGMPRSGSTLVEQIIASHPKVHGAGELDTLPSLLNSISDLVGADRPLPECVTDLEQRHLATLARSYLDEIRQLGPNAARITDKMPSNFLNLGFIELLFPHAHIIHCRRNPLDTCLSCYFQDFAGHHPYATDLRSLADYYRQYERLMKHWKNVLHIRMFEIDYEDLVHDFEPACKALIDYCGLEWDAACLDFHSNERIVVTASAEQVNRRLYKESVERWRNYQAYIGELIAGLKN